MRGQKRTPEEQARLLDTIITGRGAGLTTIEIGKQVGLSPSQISSLMPEELKIRTGKRAAQKFNGGEKPLSRKDYFSIRERIRNYLTEHRQVANVDQLVRGISQAGEDVGFQAVTTALFSMRKLSEVMFDVRSKAGTDHHGHAGEIPANIRAGRNLERQPQVNPFVPPRAAPEAVYIPPEATELLHTLGERSQEIAAVVEEVTNDWKEFPLIKQLIARQEALNQLSELAEKTGDDDIRLLALEKLDLPPLEAEAIKLWQKCHGDK